MMQFKVCISGNLDIVYTRYTISFLIFAKILQSLNSTMAKINEVYI